MRSGSEELLTELAPSELSDPEFALKVFTAKGRHPYLAEQKAMYIKESISFLELCGVPRLNNLELYHLRKITEEVMEERICFGDRFKASTIYGEIASRWTIQLIGVDLQKLEILKYDYSSRKEFIRRKVEESRLPKAREA